MWSSHPGIVAEEGYFRKNSDELVKTQLRGVLDVFFFSRTGKLNTRSSKRELYLETT